MCQRASCPLLFTLWDDDDFNGDDSGNALLGRDGDQGEDVDPPQVTDYVEVSDDPTKNKFAPAYIRPAYDIGGESFVDFHLNVRTDDATDLVPLYSFDNEATEADPAFWTVYILGAYQGATDEDGDPAKGSITFGVADNFHGIGACVFMEASHDLELIVPEPTAQTMAHEIGHLLGARHGEGGIMGNRQGYNLTTTFSPTTIDVMRSATVP